MRWQLWFLVVFGSVWISEQASRTVTLEDIRGAVIHVVQMVRQTEDKLERHEFRERQLGEQLKKSLVILDKRLKTMEPLKGTVMRLDERIAAVETILIEKNEREKPQLQKTFDTVEDIQKNLPEIIEKMKNEIVKKLSDGFRSIPFPCPPPTPPKLDNLVSKTDLQNLQKELKDKLDQVTKSISHMENELTKVKDESSKFKEFNEKSADSLEKVKRQLNDSEQLLEKYEHKLSEMNNKIPEIPIVNYKEQNEMHNNILKALDLQKTHVEKIMSDINTVSTKVSKLPDAQTAQNNTRKMLEELKQETNQQSNETITALGDKLNEVQKSNSNKHEQLIKIMQDIKTQSTDLKDDFSKNIGKLGKEIQDLSRFEQVLLQTADGVLDTKRRVEFGVHQILLEVGELLKTNMKDMNVSINDRFDKFELSVLDSETGALANLTSEIGEEIDQVWRQIGIMHQQMSASTDTLNKLQNQTDAYVNGSLNVMDSMKGKVGQITGRMAEVDENLNYLIGRLSLVTQEFNKIKEGLGTALDKIKASFIEVQNKVKDAGPGPHKLESNEVITN